MPHDDRPNELNATAALELLRTALELDANELPDVSPLQLEALRVSVPCYANLTLAKLTSPLWQSLGALYVLWNEAGTAFVLDGTSVPVFQANDWSDLALTAETVLEYARFFCLAVRGKDGPFTLFERAISVAPTPHSALARPLQLLEPGADGRFQVEGVVAYEGTLFRAVFAVAADGQIEMLSDDQLATGVAAEELPPAPGFVDPAIVKQLLGGQHLLRSLSTTSPSSTAAVSPPPPRPLPPLQILVELLLERALLARSSHRLIENFNASLAGVPPLKGFATLLMKGFPVVAVESTIAFVEEAIADVALLHCNAQERVRVIAAVPTRTDDTVVEIDVPDSDPALLLIPLFVYRSVFGLDRVVQELATRDLSAVVACDAVRSLPQSLQQIVEVTLRLPEIDAPMFSALFTRVMNAPPPNGWEAGGTHWVRNLVHTDFEQPLRLRLAPAKALDYIKSEVLERLESVDTTRAMGLKDLHGLGEAREFAEDLIADLHAAMRGELDWSQVDRGVLLAGPPGTGKTTLARAIAKDCGVRFINASASTWMSSGEHLGHHIRAIRATFAEARRHAPAILFIDEVDSVGSRQNFVGQGAQYQTEVVNAVLEQMQGLDPAAPVFVIAATNFPQKVDPALRRAGRLDRTLQIPLPNSEALTLIYEHYLKSLATGIGMDAAIDARALGGLSLGLTAADVEKIVRGSVRRARKARCPLSQADLLAELTNKPRSTQGVLRMTPQELERIALHEAGHALAQRLGATQGINIGFVTVVPRADGSLGFVASVPDERRSLMRGDYLESIEITLAGRAAEQLRYGEGGISSGASSDLALATAVATEMVLKLGFGGDRRLLVTEAASSRQLDQVEAILTEAYQSVLRKLTAEQTRLQALARALVARQELTGDEVRSLLA